MGETDTFALFDAFCMRRRNINMQWIMARAGDTRRRSDEPLRANGATAAR